MKQYNQNLAGDRPVLIVRKYRRPIRGTKRKELIIRAFISNPEEAKRYRGPSYSVYPIQDRRDQYDPNNCADRNACWVDDKLIRLRDGADITPQETTQ